MRPRRLLRSGVLALVAAAAVGGTVSPASADRAAPVAGSGNVYGAMVMYPMAFPLADVDWYEDWFWVPRSSDLHHAQDLFAPKGTPVLAVADGVVSRANASWISATENPDRCCSLYIAHDDGWWSHYLHLNNDAPGTDDGTGWGLAPGIDIGVRVTAGEIIGYVGDSGNAEDTMPHLHFELHDPDGVIVNPYDALLAAQGVAVCRVADPGRLGDLLAGGGLIRLGDRGAAVAQLQRLALAFGHDPGPVDGVFGPLTEAAVRLLQEDLAVTADGIVGDETRGAIARIDAVLAHAPALDPDGRVMSLGAVGADVEDLQTLLGLAGHDPGGADGVFGSKTRAAVRSLQSSAGITVDGIVGRETWVALADAVGVSALVSCGGG